MNQTPEGPRYHEPVMAEEVIELFRPVGSGLVIDATFGGGGHSRRLLEALGDDIRILGLDRDPEAVAEGSAMDPRVEVVNRNYRELAEVLRERNVASAAGALFDLGVSGHQVEEGTRGFSYQRRGPLDMRMGPDAPWTADDIVNHWTESELAGVIRSFGEERFSARVAAAIVAARPIEDTLHLAEVVKAAIPAAARRSGGHPARRTFQAIRIAVNEELEALSEGLEAAITHLRPGGRCVVISYHSLEDRIVKRRFVAGARGCVCPPDFPVCVCDRPAELRLLARKPVRPSAEETGSNPRARSARLRAAEKVAA